MVDLHCHILPGLDDGPATLEAAVDLARAAEAEGIETVVATPHIRDDHPFPLDLVTERLRGLRAALRTAAVDVEVVAGGEIDLAKLTELDDDTLARLCIGEGRYLLVESPYTHAPWLLETALYEVQLRGFRPVLAHPERSPTFLRDRGRLEALIERGSLCSVTAMSITGGFGKTVRAFTVDLFKAGLVHNIASDAHDAVHRAPGFRSALASLERELGCDSASLRWFTDDAGRAIVGGDQLTGRPLPGEARLSSWQRVKQRLRLS